jgi:hypothetical protein
MSSLVILFAAGPMYPAAALAQTTTALVISGRPRLFSHAP